MTEFCLFQIDESSRQREDINMLLAQVCELQGRVHKYSYENDDLTSNLRVYQVNIYLPALPPFIDALTNSFFILSLTAPLKFQTCFSIYFVFLYLIAFWTFTIISVSLSYIILSFFHLIFCFVFIFFINVATPPPPRSTWRYPFIWNNGIHVTPPLNLIWHWSVVKGISWLWVRERSGEWSFLKLNFRCPFPKSTSSKNV